MTKTGLSIGPYDLDVAIVRLATPFRGPGVYALGDMALDGRTFIVRYIGRCDDDLSAALVGHANRRHYTAFRCNYYRSPMQAFYKERELRDLYDNLENAFSIPPEEGTDNCRFTGGFR